MYHVTDPDTAGPETNNAAFDSGGARAGSPGADWRIALRVEPDAEGPSAGKLKLAAAAAGNPVRCGGRQTIPDNCCVKRRGVL